MLSEHERELIHGDVDGALTATQQAALAELLASNTDAAALHADLRGLHALFARVPARDPSPSLQASLLAVIPPRVSLFTLAVRRMEEVFMSRKLFLIGATSVAIIAIVAGRIFPIPSTGSEVGTIGGTEIDSTGMGGVQKADRYRGRAMSNQDVSIGNPELAVLFQNQDVLTLVKSDVFRQAMQSDAFRQVQANDAFRAMASQEAFARMMSSEAYARLQQNDAYRRAMASDAARQVLMSELSRRVEAKAVDARALDAKAVDARAVEARMAGRDADLAREVAQLEAFRAVMANDAFRVLMASDAFRVMMANEAFRQVMESDAFRQMMAKNAFRVLQSSEAYRSAARTAQLSELFLNEAARMK